ncbi:MULTISPECIES: aspartyl-phosphate phosphatase Spo0E family protein [Clostridium]|uniref:Aspartyl-phosphate phosphatase Spo0E family protein n=1 Tax=Clostridium senegalense TaxID=1465809 RepID=A0A6M0H339_9CLOT|nr:MULTISPECIES: aspartyl-phosphate phosphatase Spo0E family protein [Clostridium]NEU04947.1 aspartyl-phosphate phosphatase Spo0E family protein [Clostridium senegalense]
MGIDTQILEEKINCYKKILNLLLVENCITDSKVVNYSQKLDKYIVEYQKYFI